MSLERRKLLLNQPFINVSNNEFNDCELSQNFDKRGYNNYLSLFVKSCNKKICNNSFWKDLNSIIN